MQCAIPRVSSLTVALIGGGSVDAGGEEVTVVEAQPAFLYIRAGGVGPDRILLFIVQVLQLHLHFQGSWWGRGLGLRAGRAGRGDVNLDRYTISTYPSIHCVVALCRSSVLVRNITLLSKACEGFRKQSPAIIKKQKALQLLIFFKWI